MTSSLPLPSFWILTVLANGRHHGYEILRETAGASDGRVALKATTLYAALDRLARDGLIVADGEEVVDGRARRYYRISEAGTARLAQEVEVLESSVRTARERLKPERIAPVTLSAVLLRPVGGVS